jgi:CelD/BcsL family acetyltransferase involved in cellulose biosynthesis
VFRAFYRQALQGGLADGSVVLTALRDGDEVVAVQFGVANEQRYVALRLSTGGDEWKACSPGRLLCERTAQHLHEQGLRWFDFGIGDYRHKQTFGVNGIALLDGCEALSWRGEAVVWAWRLRRALKRQKWLMALLRRVKKNSHTEA